MSVDLVYVAHNRLAYVRETWAALLANTDWSLVSQLHILDDWSIDGTRQFLCDEVRAIQADEARDIGVYFVSAQFGGPVAAMKYALAGRASPLLAKVDSDLVVCPGWLRALLDVLGHNPDLDAVGMEPGFVHEPPRNGYVPAPWIGGQGLYRTDIFQRSTLRSHDRYFGLTDHLRRHANCGWIAPELPVFNLDHLPFEPWRSLAAEYVARGWSRAWEPYGPELEHCWSWWEPVADQSRTKGEAEWER